MVTSGALWYHEAVKKRNGLDQREAILRRIHTIRLPLYPERRDKRFSMNVYLIEDEQPTLIDTGPRQDEALEVLDRGLRDRGYTVADVRRIVLTHPHVNHFGLAGRIKERSDAQVCAYRGDLENYATFPMPLKKGIVRLARLMNQSMVPKHLSKQILRSLARNIRRADPVVVDVAYDDGDRLEFEDFSLEVVRTPGHTSGHACFFSYEADVLFSGDLLPESGGPVAAIMFDPDGHRFRSFPQYFRSLKKISYLAPSLIFPGHGKRLEQPRDRIACVLRDIEKESDHIASIIDGVPLSPYDLQARLNGLRREFSFRSLSWLLGHLDWLREKGAVSERLMRGRLHYGRHVGDLPFYIRQAGHA